jgi:hypothetical protein
LYIFKLHKSELRSGNMYSLTQKDCRESMNVSIAEME